MRYPCIMTNEDAEQLALDGLAPRKRRKRAPAVKTPAAEHPIAQVVLDIQATHLGQTFDYFVEEKYSAAAQPGVMVRVRFGGQRVNGIIWKRADTSATPESSIRYIERVVTDRVLVPESMRDRLNRSLIIRIMRSVSSCTTFKNWGAISGSFQAPSLNAST